MSEKVLKICLNTINFNQRRLYVLACNYVQNIMVTFMNNLVNIVIFPILFL
jgi:hypothetical protein